MVICHYLLKQVHHLLATFTELESQNIIQVKYTLLNHIFINKN